MNLAEWLLRTAKLRPEAPALLKGPRTEADYATFAARAAGIAGALTERGIAPGERVAIFMANRVEYLEALYGCFWAGVCAVPINVKLHPREAAWICGDAGAKLALISDDPGAPLEAEAGVPCLSVDSPEWARLRAGERLRRYIEQSGKKYRFAMENFIYKNYRNPFDFFNLKSLLNLSTLNVASNYRSMIRRYIGHPDLQKILEFPVVFLGSSAKTTPAMYTLMNYIDFILGTWYPEGGFSKVADSMYRVCLDLGVEFSFNSEITGFRSEGGTIRHIEVGGAGEEPCDAVVANADYPYVELSLLGERDRSIPEKKWHKKSLAPAVLNFYLALDRKLEGLAHHSFFFDSDWDEHFDAVYGAQPHWVERPLFYIHSPSVTDPHVAPEGKELLYILIPVAAGLSAPADLREKFFRHAIARMEKQTGMDIRSHIIEYHSYSLEEFSLDYHAYRGTAFGLGQTMLQTAYFRPANRSKRLSNLYYAGHYTVPGTGTTMSTISGRVVAGRIGEDL